MIENISRYGTIAEPLVAGVVVRRVECHLVGQRFTVIIVYTAWMRGWEDRDDRR